MRAITIAVVSFCLLALSACAPVVRSTTPDPTEPSPSEAEGAIRVIEQGWGLNGDGEWVSWGAVLENTGDARGGVAVTASGLDAAGSTVTSDEARPHRVPGSDTIVLGGLMVAKGVTTVEVVIDDPGVEHDELGLITGGLETELTLSGDAQDGDISAEITSSLPVATKDRMTFWILFRDEAGKISGGSSGYAPSAFEPGATRTVSLFGPTNGGLPDRFASGEIYWDISASFLEDAG